MRIKQKFTSSKLLDMIKISAVIITYNEEKNIARCIDSIADIVDEIVIIDSYSSDKTKEICLLKNAKLVEHPFKSHIEQKNFALSQANYDVILSLDADEYLSEELTESILKVKQNWVGHAYSMNRLSSYGGKWIRHGNWYPDRKIRLWDKNTGSWGGENPHDKVVINRDTKVIHLKGDLLHKAYLDSQDTIQKIQRYSEIFARENRGKKTSSTGKIIFRTFFAFIKSYVIKRGFLDGFEGLMVAMAVANHVFYKYAKLHELNSRLELGKKIIISRTDNLGDVILTLPLVGYLKSVDPTLEVYFIGKGYTKAIIEKSVFVDHFLDRDLILEDPTILKSVDSKNIIFVFPDRQLVPLAKEAGIENRIATRHRWYNWLYCNFLVEFSRVNSPLHESQLNFKLLKPFKLNEEMELSEMPKYFGLVCEPKKFDSLLSKDKFNLIIHPKSKNSAREWDVNNYFQLAKLLPNENFKIFITGLKEEGDVIRNELPEFLSSPQVIDLTGKFSLDELISFINQADGLVACSTGVLHLASALGKRALGIYSPMKPIHPGRWMPLGRHSNYLVLDKNCSDCKNSRNCACINSITPQQVSDKLLTFAREVKKEKEFVHYS